MKSFNQNNDVRIQWRSLQFLKEIVRKIIHATIAFVPLIAAWNLPVTIGLLCAGILFYAICEYARSRGRNLLLISRITNLASRSIESGFVWAPVTLGIGTLGALLFYPGPAASLAIYALAFGDSAATIAGKLWGKKGWGLFGVWRAKTFAGSMACFIVVFISSYGVLRNVSQAVIAAAVATAMELVSPKDIDNIIIPLGTGLIVFLIV